jgi:tetraacyldisaccharide 4'-kinase
VISVGNLSVGGSGKTPVVAYLAERLRDAGFPVAILSRGYGGSFGGACLVVSDGASCAVTADVAGDEPVMLARALPGVVVAVGARRDAAGRAVEARFGRRVHILDDGFQHLRLHRDLDVLCLDPADASDRPLPAGRLREFASAARRADVRLTMGRDAARRPLGYFALDGSSNAAPARAFLVSGIARPERFREDVAASGADVAGHAVFADHHSFTASEWGDVVARAQASRADAIVTTAKDAARLSDGVAAALPVLVFRIGIALENEAALLSRVMDVARRAA